MERLRGLGCEMFPLAVSNRVEEPRLPMGVEDLDVASFLAGLKDDDWKRISLRLTRYAFATIVPKDRSWHEAEDRAQVALLEVIDPKTRSWDRKVEPDFFAHLAFLVRKEASRRRMKLRRHRDTEYVEDDENDESIPGMPRTPSHEERLMKDERGQRVLALVRERAKDDVLLLRVLDLLEAHVDTIGEQAEHIGVTMMEVRNARVRLGRHVKNAEKELDGEGGSDGQ